MRNLFVVLSIFVSAGVVAGSVDQAPAQKRPDAPQLAPYVPTGHDVVDRMLSLAGVTKEDYVVDLGCGDGRIPIAAAKKYGARGLGVDIDPVRIEEAKANLKLAGVQNLVEFRLENLLQTDVSKATVVTTFLLSASNLRLRPILTKQLKPGARVVTNTFSMGDWTPAKTDTFVDATGRSRTLYLYIADGKVRQ
ncbi:MAG TPA: 50S ribosomal protein L11 methyltransferase [Vicinamibacterales bacterium]|nr:50S ribosomal protein L11 methyltransferase [Vicinamibacterales bacterium]